MPWQSKGKFIKWFKHDTDANMDAKLQGVMLDYGLEGYGLYWYCIELIAQRVNGDNLTFELEHDCRIIARNTGSTPQKVEQMMKTFIELGLLDADNGHVFCLKLASRCDDFTAKAVRRNGVKSLSNQSVGVSPTNSVFVTLEEEEEVRKRSKKKTIKDLSVITDGFDHWWNLYPSCRRKNKAGCLTKFKAKCKNLTDDQVEELVNIISLDIQKRISEADELKFIPMTEPYLNQQRWEDGQ
jgi:hypothetical protein